MLAKQSFESANGLVLWYDTPVNGERGDINTARWREPTEQDSLRDGFASVTEADRGKRAFWSSVVDFFVAGLAACGASPYPVIFCMEHPVLLDLDREARWTSGGRAAVAADGGSVRREREIRKAVAALERLQGGTCLGL